MEAGRPVGLWLRHPGPETVPALAVTGAAVVVGGGGILDILKAGFSDGAHDIRMRDVRGRRGVKDASGVFWPSPLII